MDVTSNQQGTGLILPENRRLVAGKHSIREELGDREILDALAAAIYITDAAGRILL